MVTSINYYVTDGHFIKSSILKPIIESKTQGKNILWVKKEKTILNFKDKISLTLSIFAEQTNELDFLHDSNFGHVQLRSTNCELKLRSSTTSQSWNYVFEAFWNNNMYIETTKTM